MSKKDFKPEAFGRFYLTHLIAKGGMAEIFRAKTFGQGGFEKRMAVKRILPHHSEDENFLTMLSDEARLTVQLTHPNIVQVFDFGMAQEQYYLSMELVDGIDLNGLLKDLKEKNKKIPQNLACYIVTQVCEGLEYAHNKKDNKGQPLNIVHRDISPHNILIAYEGLVKVTDFGIAKAASNLHHTQTGTVKGKVSYLSPEQALGKPIDGRSDIFATGLLLYELLLGRRLFSGNSQIEILGKVTATRVNKDMLPQDLPEELKTILAKALAYEVEERYQSADEFQEALENYLQKTQQPFGKKALSKFLHDVLAEKISESESRLDPPIDEETKSNLASYSNQDVIASAPASPELMDKTLLTGDDQPTKDVKQAFFTTSRKISLSLSILTFLLFLFSDFFKPLISLTPLFLLLSLFVLGIVYLTQIKKYLTSNPLSRILLSKPGEAFVFASLSLMIWGIATVLFLVTPQRGILASTISPVASLQDQLLGMRQDITDIKETTEEIAEGITDIKDAIHGLSKEPGLIANPKTPQEFYHNAKKYELAGQYRQAQEAYETFIQKEPNYIDVHESYQLMLNQTGGIGKTKRIYQNLEKDFSNNPVIEMMSARLLDKEERLDRLNQIISKNPDFAPAYWEYANTITDNGMALGFLTNNKIALAKRNYEKFQKLDQEGYFKEYFINKEALQNKLDTTNRFLKLYQNHYQGIFQNQISITLNRSGSGYALTIMPQEAKTQEIFYSIDRQDEFVSTGDSPHSHYANGKPMPRFQVQLKSLSPGKHTIYAKYRDKEGIESEVSAKEITIE